ncbi:MAG: B12-binding domain-containing radical SAM protein [Candidatus Hodarchaeota archaeon]
MPKYADGYAVGPQTSILFPPLGLEYVAASIDDISEVKILDNRIKSIDLNVIEETIKKFKPDYVGISCNLSSQIYNAANIARVAKNHGATTVVGGWHPTLVPDEVLNDPFIDIIVRGEGEATFRELVQNNSPKGIKGVSYKQDGKITSNPDRELLDLKYIKPPTRKYRTPEANENYKFFGFPVDAIEVNRGCPYKCTFCCIHHFYKHTYRSRNNVDVIKELLSKEINKMASIVYIIDDNFVVNRKRVESLCDAIIKTGVRKFFMTQARVDTIVNHPETFKKMADAGFLFLFLGLESFSDRTLEKLNKRIKFDQIKSAINILHDLGYIIQGNVILGADLECTRQDIESTIQIAKSMDVDMLTYSLLTPFPGTALMDHVKENDLLISNDWRKYNWFSPTIKYQNLSSEDLEHYLKKAYEETNYFKYPLWRMNRLLKARGTRFYLSRLKGVPLLKLGGQFLKNLYDHTFNGKAKRL